MSKLEIFDPAMCCSTGVCGPSVDPELLRVSTIVNILNKKGFNVVRHNLSQEPQAFVQNQLVSELLKTKGSEALPITLLDGKVVKSGSYPSRKELAEWLKIEVSQLSSAIITKKQKCCSEGEPCDFNNEKEDYDKVEPCCGDKKDAVKMNVNNQFKIDDISLTKYLFFTGKGGVGKTTVSCSIAVSLADSGKKILLISTDPASNLQDVFETSIGNTATKIDKCPNLNIINVDPLKAAEEYRESVVGPYRGIFPADVIRNMEEQLSGSCTIEIASFNEFAHLITDDEIKMNYDYVIFDTAPTGHTLRMLELPSAWTNFLNENTTGASCLGQLSGLTNQRERYQTAVDTLSNKELTTMFLVSRPQVSPIMEANRTSIELSELGITNQVLIINGLLQESNDDISEKMVQLQKEALSQIPENLSEIKTFYIPLKSYNVTGVKKVRQFLKNDDNVTTNKDNILEEQFNNLQVLINDLCQSEKKVIFTMGKGGVGKTTIASDIAKGLVVKGLKVHLTTTDPANHLNFVAHEMPNLSISHIDEKEVLKDYQKAVLAKARETMSEEDVRYVEEDLRSPCTQEIAVFRAFAEIVDKADNEVVVIDTAPTGHTLLLLESTQSYSKEISRSNGEIPESVYKLLPRLKNSKETEVVIVTLAETTPVFEAIRLNEDLKRAEINSKWWVVNQSLLATNVSNQILKAKAASEKEWIDKVKNVSNGNFVVVSWHN